MSFLKAFVFLVLSFQSLFYSFANEGERKLVLAADYRCPYTCDDGDEKSGYLVELAKDIFEIYGIKIEYKQMSWSDALLAAKEGKVDGILGLNSTIGTDFLESSTPQGYINFAVFVRADSTWVYDGVESLYGNKMAVVADYETVDVISDYISTHYTRSPEMFLMLDGKNAFTDAIYKVINSEADFLIADEFLMEACMKKSDIVGKLKKVGRVTDSPVPFYIAISNKNKNAKSYIKMIEDGISSLKNIGDMDELKKVYNIPIEATIK
jgi:polar amino acid transport system substrate-binding protein